MNPERVRQAMRDLDGWGRERPILSKSDSTVLGCGAGMPPRISSLLWREIQEFVEEFNRGDLSSADLIAELTDIFIFLDIALSEIGVDLEQSYPAAKTRAEIAAYIEDLASASQSLSGGISKLKIEEIYSLLHAIADSLPAIYDPYSQVRKKSRINGLNRPKRYYQDQKKFDSKTLTDEEIYAKFLHTEKCLRLIRNYFSKIIGEKTSLFSWMHQPFEDLILDFVHSEEALANLKLSLENSRALYQDLLRDRLRRINGGELKFSVASRELEFLSIAAGGLPIAV